MRAIFVMIKCEMACLPSRRKLQCILGLSDMHAIMGSTTSREVFLRRSRISPVLVERLQNIEGGVVNKV
jgi:hypothetical protein